MSTPVNHGTTPNLTDHGSAASHLKLDVPDKFNYTVDVFDKWARQDPSRVALMVGAADWSGIETYTFEQLRRRINQFCHYLRRLGIRKGDRILVLMGWCPEWYVAILGMIKLGVVPIPTTTQSRPKDLLYRLDVAGIVGICCSNDLAAVVDQVAAQSKTLRHKMVVGAGPGRTPAGWTDLAAALSAQGEEFGAPEPTRSDDAMLIYFTSGTVSLPKMVLHTQASYGIGHTLTATLWGDLKPTDTHWTMTDTGWGKAAWGCLFGQWTIGATVFVSAARKFEPQHTLHAIARAGITTFCAPPTVYRILVREDLRAYDLSSLRHCTSAGEPLNPEVIRVWQEAVGVPIHDGYGQTETVNMLANFRGTPIKPGSMGKPVPGFDLRILDDDGNEQPPGNEGHIALRVKPHRPVGFFREYVDAPELMAQAFRGDYYYTGDRAYRDSDGYFWFVGRGDDVIITSGYRIGPFEVESALLEHPAVKESAVVSSPNETRGEIVKAFVVLREGFAPSPNLMLELQQTVRSITAPYKYPRAIEFVKELPKTVSGKIRRSELRHREWSRPSLSKGLGRRRRRVAGYGRTYRRLGVIGVLERLRRAMTQ